MELRNMEEYFDEELLREELKKNPNLLKFYGKLQEIIAETYKQYFAIGFNLTDEKAEEVNRTLKIKKFPFKIKTEYAYIEGTINPVQAIIASYALVLELLESRKKNAWFPNKDDEEFAHLGAAAFLAIFIPKLRKEFESVVSETYSLSFAEFRRLISGSLKGQKELIEQITKLTEKRRKKDSGIKRGGSKPRKGFKWTEERKIEFYKTVVALPQINGVSIWQYAYDELKSKDFSWRIKDYLEKETELKNAPKDLFDKAFKAWRKYPDEFVNPKPEDSPRAFEFLHTLHQLDYGKAKFSSLRNYFYEGKKLFDTYKN